MIAPRLRVENPVLTKELRTRMRGARSYWILFFYLFVLSIILFFSYLTWWQSQQRFGMSGQAAFTVGKTFYQVLFGTQAVLVGLITPALTAGGITMEREQRTYELLSVSLMPRRSIVVGKLSAATSFVALLLTSSLPLVSLCFLLGGVSPAEVFASFILLVVTALLYGAVGVAWSALSKSTSTATVMTYGTILLLFFATLPLTVMGLARVFGGPANMGGLTALNPVGAVLAGTLPERYFFLTLPAWLPALILNGLLAVILIVVAVHRLEFPASDRSGLLRGLTAIFAALLLFCVYGALMPANGAVAGLGIANASDRFMTAAVATVLGTVLLVPIFVTGDGLPRAGGLLSAFDPRRLRRGEAPSGLTYSLLIGVLTVAMMTFGATPAIRDRIPGVAVLIFASIFGFGAFGLFVSALTENRWSAFAVTFAVMLLAFLVPMTSLTSYERGSPGSIFDNFLYLSPAVAAVQAGMGNKFWSDGIPPLAGGRSDFFWVTGTIYLVFGVACWIGAGVVHRRRQRGRAALATT